MKLSRIISAVLALLFTLQLAYGKAGSTGAVIGDSKENINKAVNEAIAKEGVPKSDLQTSEVAGHVNSAISEELEKSKKADVRNSEEQYLKLQEVLATEKSLLESKKSELEKKLEDNEEKYNNDYGLMARAAAKLGKNNDAKAFKDSEITPLEKEIKALKKSIKSVNKTESNILAQKERVLKDPLLSDIWQYYDGLTAFLKEQKVQLSENTHRTALLKMIYLNGSEKSASLAVKLYKEISQRGVGSKNIIPLVDIMVKNNLGVSKVDKVIEVFEKLDNSNVDYSMRGSVASFIISMNITAEKFLEVMNEFSDITYSSRPLLAIAAIAKKQTSEAGIKNILELYEVVSAQSPLSYSYNGLVTLQMILNNKTKDDMDAVADYLKDVYDIVPSTEMIPAVVSVGMSKGFMNDTAEIKRVVENVILFDKKYTSLSTYKDGANMVSLYLSLIAKHKNAYEQHISSVSSNDSLHVHHTDSGMSLLEMYIWYSIYTNIFFDHNDMASDYETFDSVDSEYYVDEFYLDDVEVGSGVVDTDIESEVDFDASPEVDVDPEVDLDMEVDVDFDMEVDVDVDVDFDVSDSSFD